MYALFEIETSKNKKEGICNISSNIQRPTLLICVQKERKKELQNLHQTHIYFVERLKLPPAPNVGLTDFSVSIYCHCGRIAIRFMKLFTLIKKNFGGFV